MRIRRIQERDGSLTEMTKTEAGTRDIPMGSVLREMLLAWRVRCPRLNGELHRVFPGPGRLEAWPKPRTGGGGPLLYQNFRRRYWEPAFKHLGLPLRDASLGAPQLHLDDASAGRRGGSRGKARRARERRRYARPLHPSSEGRASRRRGARARLCSCVTTGLMKRRSEQGWRVTARSPRIKGCFPRQGPVLGARDAGIGKLRWQLSRGPLHMVAPRPQADELPGRAHGSTLTRSYSSIRADPGANQPLPSARSKGRGSSHQVGCMVTWL